MATRSGTVSDLRVGFVSYGDILDPSESSGMPFSVTSALRQFVGEVVPISTEPPGLVYRAASYLGRATAAGREDLHGSPLEIWRRLGPRSYFSEPVFRARQETFRRRLQAAGRLDMVILHGAEIVAPTGLASVTYQDSTLVQAFRSYPWPHLEGFRETDVARWARRQSQVYGSVSACCCMSAWVKESLIADYGLPADRIHVVGVGANHVPEPPAARDFSVPRFLFITSDFQRKNGAAVLRAFDAIHTELPAATLDVVGAHPPIDQSGVRAHGFLSLRDPQQRAVLERLFAEATVFVQPSLHDPSPSALVEAGLAGLPLIGSSNGGSSTCVGPGGMVVDPGSESQLVEAMRALCDPSSAARLGGLAREHAQLLTWRLVAERLVRAAAPAGIDVGGLAPFL